jgi:hypothetical protein
MCQLSPVTFHGDTIFCVTIENQPYTPAKPIVENMGLAWQAQAAKLSANKERWGIMMIVIPSESGEQETICIPVRKLPAFLASINPKKVKPELRERIELYQAECDDALWNYWMNGRAERAASPDSNPAPLPSSPDSPLTPDQQCTLQAIVRAKVEALPREQRGGLYPKTWSRFNNHFRLAKYCQLPQSRLSEAVIYLTQLDVTEGRQALPTAPTALSPAPAPAFRTDFPADMHTGRKDALRKIQSLMAGVGAARDVVRLFCHPGGKSMRMTLDEREIYDALYQLYCAADDSLLAAYRALDAGYKIGRQYGRG